MSEKTFSRFEKSQIMNTAKVLKNFIVKKDSLQKKIDDLREEIRSIDDQQKRWESPIMELLCGHRLEDVVEYQRELQASGKYSTKIVFRYPDTILPPASEAREADINEDMPGHYEGLPEAEKEPEYDSAGFSTEDGLAEGESAELAETVAEADDDPFSFD